MKKYDSYKDSGIEWLKEIPIGWNLARMRYVCDISTGDKDTINKEENGNYPFYVRSKNIERISTYTYDEEAILTPGDGDICKIWHYINGKFECHQRVYKLTKFSEVTGKFLYYFLMQNFENEVFKLSAKSTVDSLRRPMFQNFPIAFGTIEEQNKITFFLDNKISQIDHLVAKKEQFIQLLEEERVAVINQAVTKGLDPNVELNDSGIELLGGIPKHWEVKKLKQIFNSSKGLTITKENLESEGIPCVNYGEIHSKFGFEVDIDKHQLKCVNPTYLESDYKSLIQTGDFVFADTSEDVSGAGNFTYLKSNHEIFAGYHTIILRALVDIESRYFAYQFDSIPYRTQIRQSVKGIKVFSITQAILKNTSLWIPPLEEQKQIIQFLDIETDRIVSLKNSARKEIELLKEYKTALISEVVTGKVDVRELL